MNQTPTKPTLDQQRASHALKMVKSFADDSRNDDGMYVSYVSALPATIVMNGIGQALATELAKDKGKGKSHRHLFNHLAVWLSEPGRPLDGTFNESNPTSIFDALCKTQQTYIDAQVEAMAYIHWLKQFARAFLADRSFPDNSE